MSETASKQAPEWAADVMDIFRPPEWPWMNRSIEPRAWENWANEDECLGQWEILDPFPKVIARIWDELYTEHAPQLYRNGDSALRTKLLKVWETKFTSMLIHLKISDFNPVNHYLEPEGPVPSNCYFVGTGQVAQILYWRRANCNHQGHPHAGCNLSVRQVIPVPPSSNMHYWLAQVEDGKYCFNAVLETPRRVDLGARGPVKVCRSQQILELYLPSAARFLGFDWELLPTIIARSQIEDLFFRAYRTRLKQNFIPTEEWS